MFNIFKRKEDKDLFNVNNKEKNTQNNKNKINNEKVITNTATNSEKKSETQDKRVRKVEYEKNIKNIMDIPGNALIISEEKNSKYLIKEELQDAAVVLACNYAPNKNGVPRDCVMLIIDKDTITKIPHEEFKKQAGVDKKVFVYLSSASAKALIKEVRKKYGNEKRRNKNIIKDGSDLQLRLINMFEEAEEQKVSDIHIEVSDREMLLRTRINGELIPFEGFSEGYRFSAETGYEFARGIYNTLSSEASTGTEFNARFFQNTVLEIQLQRTMKKLRIRVATAPTEPKGFDMVMRLLVIQDSSKPLTLEQLGYDERSQKEIINAINQAVGTTIIAGTTGSGKSTTLQNLLMGEINNRNGRIKVITVEDPPEYFIPGASQIPVVRDKNGDGKVAFKNAIKAAMRMDPDVIMIGEVRDEQSAELLIEAVQTGHKVFSTIHASSALGIIPRLEGLGIKRDVLGANEFISGLIYQKLFPVLCPHCSIELINGYVPDKKPMEHILVDQNFVTSEQIAKAVEYNKDIPIIRALLDLNQITLKDSEEAISIYKELNNKKEKEEFLKRLNKVVGNVKDVNIRFRGNGCEHCMKGIKGRTVVAEVVRPDMEMRELISSGKEIALLKYWKKNLGGKTAKEDAYEKMKKGIISPIDVEEILGFMGLE